MPRKGRASARKRTADDPIDTDDKGSDDSEEEKMAMSDSDSAGSTDEKDDAKKDMELDGNENGHGHGHGHENGDQDGSSESNDGGDDDDDDDKEENGDDSGDETMEELVTAASSTTTTAAAAAAEVTSPSPEKKGMQMRSGRRKRRRSKETSGLTPPEQSSKKARRAVTERRAGNRRPPRPLNDEKKAQTVTKPSRASTTTATATTTSITKTTRTRTSNSNSILKSEQETSNDTIVASVATVVEKKKRIGRESFLSSDATALANAHYSETSLQEGGILADGDSNRRLFDRQPPVTTPLETKMELALEDQKKGEKTEPSLKPADVRQTTENSAEEEVEEEEDDDDDEDEEESSSEESTDEYDDPYSLSPKSLIWRVVFMILFAIPLFTVMWPICINTSNYLIPVNNFTVPEVPKPTIPIKIQIPDEPLEVEQEEDIDKEIPTDFIDATDMLGELQRSTTEALESMKETRSSLGVTLGGISMVVTEHKTAMERLLHLQEAEETLTAFLDENLEAGIDDTQMKELQHVTSGLGKTIIDTSAISIWQVNRLLECDVAAAASVVDDGKDDNGGKIFNPELLLDPTAVEAQLDRLKEMAQSSAENVMNSSSAKELIRDWIKEKITVIVEEDDTIRDSILKLEDISSERPMKDSIDNSSYSSSDEIKKVIEERLVKEMADRTGEYDHASIFNGAKIIRNGKRATSKSMIDSLPILNQLLHLWRLQFYGYGPEIAITPTFPVDSLGQCWSFIEPPIEELLKKPRSEITGDEPKNGNLGTLSVSLSTAVEVISVIIEHPPPGLSDRADSAIRNFRVMGFEDSNAESKAWPLGSFEFDNKSLSGLQEFEVETEVFGNPVPPLQSITLAIDSNWGAEYTCVYRFRVHGDEELDEDMD